MGNHNLAKIYIKRCHNSVIIVLMICVFKLDLHLMMLYPFVNITDHTHLLFLNDIDASLQKLLIRNKKYNAQDADNANGFMIPISSYHVNHDSQATKQSNEGKYQESIQSSTTLVPGHSMVK